MKRLFYAFVFIIATASCEKAVTTAPEISGGLEPISFTTGGAALDYDIVTRSDFGTMRSGGFGLFGYNTLDEDFNVSSPSEPSIVNYKLVSSDGQKWEYEGAVAYWNKSSEDKYTFLAYHPYEEGRTSPDITLPVEDMNIDECEDYLVAEPVLNLVEKGAVALKFNHIYSKINTSIKLSKAYDGQEYSVKQVTFRDVREYPLFSLAKNDFDRTSSTVHTIASENTNISGTVLKTTSDVVTVDPIYISPYDYQTQGRTIKIDFVFEYDYTDKNGVELHHEFTKTIELQKNLERNRYYDLNVKFIPDKEGGIEMNVCFNDYVMGEGSDLIMSQVEQVNLSESATANCYIVPKAGTYCFDATYKGNSTVETVGEIADVELLWEFTTRIVDGALISDLRHEGAKVYFTASDMKGNALIAGKDASGKILWSWHIWMTDQPFDQKYRNDAGVVMDRNLGSISSLPEDSRNTWGMYYQWGRKDPFVNSTVGDNTFSNSKEKLTADIADENPTLFGSNESGWLTPEDMTRWDSVGDGSGTKTIHDPCPPGYRVPKGGPEGLWAKAVGAQEFWKEGIYNEKLKTHDFNDILANGCWYPDSGYMSYPGTVITEQTGHGYYWSNTSADSKVYLMSFYGTSIKSYVLNSLGKYLNSFHYAYPVRCAKE